MRLFFGRIACGGLAAMLTVGVALPGAAGAQTVPPYATPGSAPAIGNETVRGVIEAIEGPYRIAVRDERGFLDDVTLRRGTIINPRGLRLRAGMSVTIAGYASGTTFEALEIDAPYSYDAAGAGSSYYSTYPDYGYGYGYGEYYVGSPGAPVIVIQQPVVVVSPPPGAVRRIEPPHANRPVRRPLDDKPDRPLPPYVIPPTAFRGSIDPGRTPDRASWSGTDRASTAPAPNRGWSGPDRSQAAAPQYHAPAPEYHAPPPPPPPARSEPAPQRENRAPSAPSKPH